MPILVIKKLRFRDVKTLVQGQTSPVLVTASIILKASVWQ